MSNTIPSTSVSLEGARAVLDAALAHATTIDAAVCIVIVDPAGQAVLAARMDGAPRLSADIAADKAYTVTAFNGRPTDQWWPGLKDMPEILDGLAKMPRFTILGGGVPLRVSGKLVGAVGVSGGSSEQDVEIATAGAAVIA
jgi:uncharacterized protein GlcG (DUF336 family)